MEVDDDGLAQTPEEVSAVASLLAKMRAPGGGCPAPRVAPRSASPAAATTPVSRKRVALSAASPTAAQVDLVEDSDQELLPDDLRASTSCIYGKGQGRGTSAARAAADPYDPCSTMSPLSLDLTQALQAAVAEPPVRGATAGDQVFGQGAALTATVQ